MKILLTTLFFQAIFTWAYASNEYTYLPEWIKEQENICRLQQSDSAACLEKTRMFAQEVLACEESAEKFSQVAVYDQKLMRDLVADYKQLPLPTKLENIFLQLTDAADSSFGFKFTPPQWRLLLYSADYRNAHAAVTGLIALSNGFFVGENPFSYEEVAAILAHEVAHVVLRHYHRQGCVALEWMGTSVDLREALIEMKNDFSLTDRRGKVWSSLSQKHEFEADQLATLILINAGMDPKLMGQALTKLKPKTEPWFITGSHPDLGERIKRLP